MTTRYARLVSSPLISAVLALSLLLVSASALATLNPCVEGYHQLTIVVTTNAENVVDGDDLWDDHHAYIKSSHRFVAGEPAPFVVTYSLTKGVERENPLDPASNVTGRTTYVLNECYRTSEDILLHWSKTSAEWDRFVEIIAWMQRPGTQVVTLHDGVVRNSLWQLGDIL
ncbi:hypothetical protein [Pseudoxanthomonas sp. UTMC 1351]|uniref:hypothetical protein n=1 Tax=Pseudoxanthomonas sp. UTMC 1351 TaxID=2695853 RepID=UPI0034CE9D03